MRSNLLLAGTILTSAVGCRDVREADTVRDPCAAPQSVELAVARANAVFEADVIRVWDSVVPDYQSREYGRQVTARFATVEPVRWWKQVVPGSPLTMSAALPNDSSCLVPFVAGERYLVYGLWIHGVPTTLRHMGTRLVTEAQADLEVLGPPLPADTVR